MDRFLPPTLREERAEEKINTVAARLIEQFEDALLFRTNHTLEYTDYTANEFACWYANVTEHQIELIKKILSEHADDPVIAYALDKFSAGDARSHRLSWLSVAIDALGIIYERTHSKEIRSIVNHWASDYTRMHYDEIEACAFDEGDYGWRDE